MQEIDSTILFGRTVEQLNTWFRTHKYSSIHVLCDTNTFRKCWPRIENVDWPSQPHVIVIPPGEVVKNLQTCETVWDAFISDSADRSSLLINLGGGVVTDLGGFCAASFMRGIQFLHVPTTVLAMTDAAIGGKHGVDFRMYKNYVGTFAEPECIIVDVEFITSLETLEVKCGMAEIIKHGVIADPVLMDIVRKADNLNSINWDILIKRSIEVKLKFVRDDIRDHGTRAALNFGHTIGHAIETSQLLTETPMRHGEAVALGMLVETAISKRQLALSNGDCTMIEVTIRQLFPDLRFPDITSERLLKLIGKDKKKNGTDVLFSLIKSLGMPVVGQKVPPSIVNEAYLHCKS